MPFAPRPLSVSTAHSSEDEALGGKKRPSTTQSWDREEGPGFSTVFLWKAAHVSAG